MSKSRISADKRKVLVVDDSPVVRSFHSNILKSAGFRVDNASDGAEALEKALSRDYNLILCDINMPNMDGIAFLRRYREEGKETPTIIITTQEEMVNRKKCYEAGANLYLVKPIKPSSLILHIRVLLSE
jgi:two-component system chemotaxis response regulator CheY